jgi:hypothetical protein
MLISTSHKFIFIHIPKTAGTSIRSVLNKHAAQTNKVMQKVHQKNKMIKSEHIGASDIKHILEGNLWKKYFKFAFVRNPWEIMLSHYLYFSNRKGWSLLHQRAKKLTFNKFIDWYFLRAPKVNYNKGFRRGFEYFIEINNEQVLDFIGKFENLKEDFASICKKLNIQEIDLPIKNKSDHKHYNFYYNDHAKRLVKNAFEKHLDYFKYTF